MDMDMDVTMFEEECPPKPRHVIFSSAFEEIKINSGLKHMYVLRIRIIISLKWELVVCRSGEAGVGYYMYMYMYIS